MTIGELRRGVEMICHPGDLRQATLLEEWLEHVLADHGERVLSHDCDAAQLWRRMRVPNPQPAIDKQIAAIALLHDPTVVARNTDDIANIGVRLMNLYSRSSKQTSYRQPVLWSGQDHYAHTIHLQAFSHRHTS